MAVGTHWNTDPPKGVVMTVFAIFARLDKTRHHPGRVRAPRAEAGDGSGMTPRPGPAARSAELADPR